MKIPAKLSVEDMVTSHVVAVERATSKEIKVDRSFQKLSWHENIARDAEAAGAEIAFAKWLGIQGFTPTVDTFKGEADVGSKYEIKWTSWVDGNLILTERDREQDIAVLVTGHAPNVYLCGWVPISMARRHKQRRSDGSWWIGQSDLHPMENLRRSLHGENTSL